MLADSLMHYHALILMHYFGMHYHGGNALLAYTIGSPVLLPFLLVLAAAGVALAVRRVLPARRR